MLVAAQEHETRRGVAQPGSVLAWGASGRPFKSARPDQFTTVPDECREEHIQKLGTHDGTFASEAALSSFFYV